MENLSGGKVKRNRHRAAGELLISWEGKEKDSKDGRGRGQENGQKKFVLKKARRTIRRVTQKSDKAMVVLVETNVEALKCNKQLKGQG